MLKFTLEQVTSTQIGSRGIAVLFFNFVAWGGGAGQRHAQAAFPPGTTRCTLYRKLGGLQVRSGRVRKISPPPEFDDRIVQLVASCYTDWAISVHIRAGYGLDWSR